MVGPPLNIHHKEWVVSPFVVAVKDLIGVTYKSVFCYGKGEKNKDAIFMAIVAIRKTNACHFLQRATIAMN
jgi:hypothetical protein